MKKLIYCAAFAIAVVIVACGGEKKEKKGEDFVANEEPTETAAASDPIAKGEALVKDSDCKTCHHKTNKLIGPPHLDVAKKYEFTKANVEMLGAKIKNGGKGNWGEVPMSAHPTLTVAESEMMARYVLSLDGEKEH